MSLPSRLEKEMNIVGIAVHETVVNTKLISLSFSKIHEVTILP
jgi:hypothetical protein